MHCASVSDVSVCLVCVVVAFAVLCAVCVTAKETAPNMSRPALNDELVAKLAAYRASKAFDPEAWIAAKW